MGAGNRTGKTAVNRRFSSGFHHMGTANLIPEPQIRRGHFDPIINTTPRLISDAEIKEFETYLMRLHQLKYYK